jgi:hypothetical protein
MGLKYSHQIVLYYYDTSVAYAYAIYHPIPNFNWRIPHDLKSQLTMKYCELRRQGKTKRMGNLLLPLYNSIDGA